MSLTPPSKRPEVADGAARQSEGIARLPIPRPLRQGVPTPTCWPCLLPLPSQRRGGGVDGQRFEDIETYGLERWLGRTDARTEEPRRIDRSRSGGCGFPSPTAKQRPLGIPTVRDRVVQMAAVLVLEPIFEADLPAGAVCLPPATHALDAVQEVQRLLRTGHMEVVDADLSGYFDSIPHAELMKSVARRIVDRRDAASDQDVAGSAGRRDGRAGEPPSNDPQQGRGTAVRKGLRSRRCWQTCTCAASSWAGRRWATRSV